ncbi:hypothetical protein B566_EDAN012956 [Ephemera danica]|nr:hypothetical protein B566_EDAN012956 [Ephemera danica]
MVSFCSIGFSRPIDVQRYPVSELLTISLHTYTGFALFQQKQLDTVPIMEALSSTVPCREKQWKLLTRILDGEALPNQLFLYGHSGTGKTHVTTAVLNLLEIDFVRINCVEFDSVPLLASAISSKILDVYFHEDSPKKCTTLMDLVYIMQKVAQNPDNRSKPFVIVLERCERLKNMPSYALPVLPALLKLKELSGMNVCTILISDIIWEKFYCKTWFIKPIKIFFPHYSQAELVELICLETPDGISKNLYDSYAKISVKMLYRFCHDLNELCFIINQHLPHVKKLQESNDIMQVFHSVAPHLKESISKLHLRGAGLVQDQQKDQLLVSGLELPFYAKYLLIASFLASYNAPKHDKRLFMKFHGKEKKRMATKAKSVKMSSLLVGPKSFSFERLVAIFNAINDETGLSTSLCAQLTTLVNLKLINRIGFANLSDPKYSCAVGLAFITEIGNQVGFNVPKYIMEDN